MKVNLLLSLCLTYVFYISSIDAACTVTTNGGLGSPEPLYLIPGLTTSVANDAYYWPTNGADSIVFNDGDVVDCTCVGGTVSVSGTNQGVETAPATCNGGTFNIGGQSVQFSQITCSRMPFHTARYSGATCNTNYRHIEQGYLLSTGRFIKHLDICFDDVAQNTLYSKSTISKAIAGHESGVSSITFIQDNFYSVGTNSVDNLYTRNTQRATINPLVGLPSGDFTYIHDTDDYFLSRGHLAAKADLIYGSHQQMTYHFVNAAPQWQTFNGANWNILEQNVRDYIGGKYVDHDVYTGTHGKLTLANVNTLEAVPIHLYVDGTTTGIPAPEVYWKVLYNVNTMAGIAFVGVNDPYKTTYTPYCTDICGQLNWLTWTPTDQKNGFSYCCDVNELKAVFPEIPPELVVTSVLT